MVAIMKKTLLLITTFSLPTLTTETPLEKAQRRKVETKNLENYLKQKQRIEENSTEFKVIANPIP